MAMSDEIREQRKLLKGKGPGAYLKYFLDYYLAATLAVAAGIGVVIYLIVTFVSAKPTGLGVYFLNAYLEDNTLPARIEEDFAAYAGIDTSQYEVTVDMSKYLQPGAQISGASGTTTQAVLVTHIAAGMVDVMVADADNFYYYLESGTFGDLRDFLSEEELEVYEDQLIYISGAAYAAATGDAEETEAVSEETEDLQESSTEGWSYDESAVIAEALAAEKVENFVRQDPDELEDPVPVGIMVQDTEFVSGTDAYEDTVVIAGIIISARRPENAVAFVNYLMTQSTPAAGEVQ